MNKSYKQCCPLTDAVEIMDKRFLSLRWAFFVATLLLLLLLPLRSRAEELVAIVDLKFIKETDQVAAVLCLGDTDDDCSPWAYHYLWEARVRKIVSGTETEKRFLVLYGRHALMKKDFRGIIAVMKKLDSMQKSEPRYQIREWAKERKLACFDSLSTEKAPLNLKSSEERSFGCYDLESDD